MVFWGVLSDEYLYYAMANQREWEKKGKDIVASNFAKYKEELENRPESKGYVAEMAPLPMLHQ